MEDGGFGKDDLMSNDKVVIVFSEYLMSSAQFLSIAATFLSIAYSYLSIATSYHSIATTFSTPPKLV